MAAAGGAAGAQRLVHHSSALLAALPSSCSHTAPVLSSGAFSFSLALVSMTPKGLLHSTVRRVYCVERDTDTGRERGRLGASLHYLLSFSLLRSVSVSLHTHSRSHSLSHTRKHTQGRGVGGNRRVGAHALGLSQVCRLGVCVCVCARVECVGVAHLLAWSVPPLDLGLSPFLLLALPCTRVCSPHSCVRSLIFARSLSLSLALSLARSLFRSLSCSLSRSLARTHVHAHSFARSLALALALARTLSRSPAAWWHCCRL